MNNDHKDLSHFSVEQKQCECCLETWDTKRILFNREAATLDTTTITAMSICDDCQCAFDEGYTILIEADSTQSKINEDNMSHVNHVKRTGRALYLHKGFIETFELEVPKRADGEYEQMVYIDIEDMKELSQLIRDLIADEKINDILDVITIDEGEYPDERLRN